MSRSSAFALGGGFTAAELAAADQLVQLSGGSVEDEASTTSPASPRSVNTTAVADEEEGKEEVGLDRRARKRYRLVSELYAATRPVKGGGKRKREEMETR